MQPLDEASILQDRSTASYIQHSSQGQPHDSQNSQHQEQNQQRQQRNPHSVILPPITHLERHSWPSETINHSSTTPRSTSSTQQGQIVFTRQLWSRSMTNEPIDVLVSKHPSTLAAETSNTFRETVDGRRTSSVPSRSLHRPPTSPESHTPLTPEESPPYRSTRKRAASIVEEEDVRSYGSAELSPSHGRASSGDSAVQVCICQPDPKIPRPRNAFILYRQHHQANVIAEHPGLANPEISKIIGEQWRNQPADVKNEWKRLAEEEKVRHQQQYPSYRYQPKRNTRRNSLTDTPGSSSSERAKCPKCGGRTTLAPSFHGNYTSLNTSPSMVGTGSIPPQTPTSATTPTSRTLPVLRELTLQSPARDPRRMGRPNPMPEISPRRIDDRDEALMSPDSKRRRFNNEQPVTMYRAMPPRYSVASPGSPYVITQSPHPHPYPPAQAQAQIMPQQIITGHARRESLPSLRMVSPPGPMAPPPRPGMGYQQHRMSQGHVGPDRSLTLPPLKTGRSIASPEKKSPGTRSSQDVMTSLTLSEKLEVLRRIAPPAAIDDKNNRGPLIAVEGDSPDAVEKFAKWLVETLGKEEEMEVQLHDSPDVKEKEDGRSAMAAYHVLAAEWLDKTRTLLESLSYDTKGKDVIMTSPSEMDTTQDTSQPAPEAGKNSADTVSRMSIDESNAPQQSKGEQEAEPMQTDAPLSQPPPQTQSQPAASPPKQPETVQTPKLKTKKPVITIPLFSLYTTNVFSCRIPITDVYSPKEHWQWSATLWRGIIGPDLTIYLRDVEGEDMIRPVEHSEIERLFVVKRGKDVGDGSTETGIESATLRRVGFEVSEWIRAFGDEKKA